MSILVELQERNTRIVPISEPNKVQAVKKLENGDLEVTFKSGATTVLDKDDELFQEFVIYTVIAGV